MSLLRKTIIRILMASADRFNFADINVGDALPAINSRR
jgi:hypothetical protein